MKNTLPMKRFKIAYVLAVVAFIFMAVISFIDSALGEKITPFALAAVPVAFRPGAGAPAVVNAGSQRAILNKFLQKMRGLVVTPAYLRDDTLISTGSAMQQFSFTLTQSAGGTALACAQRLKQNDAFCVTSIGLYIGKAVAAATVTTAVQQGSTVLQTFPDALVFTGAGDSVSLQMIYNGWLSIKEGSTTYFEQLEALRFYRVGTAQAGTLLFTASNQLASTWEGSNYGQIDITPQFEMAGNRSYHVALNMPAAMPALTAAATHNIYGVIRLSGFLATGGASRIG